MLVAITREVSPSIDRCKLTHMKRQTIDIDLARAQHRQYETCLADLGCEVHCLPAEPELPDAVFVEDTAIALDGLAVIARPGAESRRLETESIADALRPYRRLSFIEPPGTLDGGDVLRVGTAIYVGLSSRTNLDGMEQLRALADPLGYSVKGLRASSCLHLKSALTQVAEGTLLINRSWVEAQPFAHMNLIDVDASEPFGANALLIGDAVIYPAAYPGTRRRLEEHGIGVRVVDVSEIAKAEGGVTCCSLVFDV